MCVVLFVVNMWFLIVVDVMLFRIELKIDGWGLYVWYWMISWCWFIWQGVIEMVDGNLMLLLQIVDMGGVLFVCVIVG